MKTLLVVFGLLFWSHLSNAAHIDQDWQTPSDANIIYDTDTGMR